VNFLPLTRPHLWIGLSSSGSLVSAISAENGEFNQDNRSVDHPLRPGRRIVAMPALLRDKRSSTADGGAADASRTRSLPSTLRRTPAARAASRAAIALITVCSKAFPWHRPQKFCRLVAWRGEKHSRVSRHSPPCLLPRAGVRECRDCGECSCLRMDNKAGNLELAPEPTRQPSSCFHRGPSTFSGWQRFLRPLSKQAGRQRRF
jgi:hypothetical protein